MGLGPHNAERGDKICILNGGQFPIILRQEYDSWLVVGESYVHGIMDGEAGHQLSFDESGAPVLQRFVIK